MILITVPEAYNQQTDASQSLNKDTICWLTIKYKLFKIENDISKILTNFSATQKMRVEIPGQLSQSGIKIIETEKEQKDCKLRESLSDIK